MLEVSGTSEEFCKHPTDHIDAIDEPALSILALLAKLRVFAVRFPWQGPDPFQGLFGARPAVTPYRQRS